MLSAAVAPALVVLATLLMAVVIFAPVRDARTPTVSCAPPIVPVREAWDAPALLHEARADAFAWPYGADAFVQPPPAVDASVSWTALIHPRANACDEGARVEIAEALGHVGSRWAQSVLAAASADDPSAAVRAAAASALDALSARVR